MRNLVLILILIRVRLLLRYKCLVGVFILLIVICNSYRGLRFEISC